MTTDLEALYRTREHVQKLGAGYLAGLEALCRTAGISARTYETLVSQHEQIVAGLDASIRQAEVDEYLNERPFEAEAEAEADPVDTAPAFEVTFIGPNLPSPLCDKGAIHVHKKGCADLNKLGYRGASRGDLTVRTDCDVVTCIYPLGDFNYDPDTDEIDPYFEDVYFAPCVKDLPPVGGETR